MRKIFLTGSSGFIGKNLRETLPYTFTTYNRNASIIPQLNSSIPDIIINCGAEIYEPTLMFDTNLILLKSILDYCALNKCHLIQIGSSSEYGRKSKVSNEKDVLEPTNLYEATKGAGTLLCQGYSRYYRFPCSIIRPYSVYGVHEKPHRFIPTLIRSLLFNSPMDVYEGVHDFIYIRDFVRGVQQVIQKQLNCYEQFGYIINLGSGIQYTNEEVCRTAQDVFGLRGNITFKKGNLREFDSRFWCADTSNAWLNYDFKTMYSLRQGLEDLKGIYARHNGPA